MIGWIIARFQSLEIKRRFSKDLKSFSKYLHILQSISIGNFLFE